MNIGIPLKPVIFRINLQRGQIFGFIIICALFAFEVFNYSTTEFALTDLLGNLRFAGIRWATILAIAFCGIDFAGLARLLTPEEGTSTSAETWYLFSAWLLAATMNALLTWWGISIAILNHKTIGNSIIDNGTMVSVVPIFIAIIVWLTRVLIIGTFSTSGKQLNSQTNYQSRVHYVKSQFSDQLVKNEFNIPKIERVLQPKPFSPPTISNGPQMKIVRRQEPVYTAIESEIVHNNY